MERVIGCKKNFKAIALLTGSCRVLEAAKANAADAIRWGDRIPVFREAESALWLRIGQEVSGFKDVYK